jgi:endonuclease G
MIQPTNRWESALRQFEKADQHADGEGLDVTALADANKDKKPRELESPRALAERRAMLRKAQGDAQDAFERLIDGDELQPVNYLPRGLVAARPICRLTVKDDGGIIREFATGFLIAPNVLLTNNHVFPEAGLAANSIAEFDYERDVYDNLKKVQVFRLRPDQLFETSAELDFSVVAVETASREGLPLASFGFLPLIRTTGKAVEGEWLTIIQHPDRREKQVCIRENKLLKRGDDVLLYSTDTLPGSSGAPVFNNSWQVVALHHSGVPEMKDGVWQTIDGRDYDKTQDDPKLIKWVANEGIRVSRVVDGLQKLNPDSPLLKEVFEMTAERAIALTNDFARLIDPAAQAPLASAQPAPVLNPPPAATRTAPKMVKSINVTLDIADDGRVSVRQAGTVEGLNVMVEAGKRASYDQDEPESDLEFEREEDFSPGGARKGYDPGFLGNGFEVPLPGLGAIASDALELDAKWQNPKKAQDPNNKHALHYLGYTVVMHKRRKFAIYSAANIDGSGRHKLPRPRDVWQYDPRILRSDQIGEYYYGGNQFDKGHLTRREDMEYGKLPDDALKHAADTMYFTNCTPQHAKFNREKKLWQGLEQHILEQAVKAAEFSAQVFTGPVLDEGDPVWEKYRNIQYPLKFWKVAAARARPHGEKTDRLFAAAFVLDQADVITQYGIEAAVEVPFGAFKTYQVPIKEIERLTGLVFHKTLHAADPLGADKPARASRRRRPPGSARESALAGGGIESPDYVLVESRFDIITGT